MIARANFYLAMTWVVCVLLSTVAAVSNFAAGATAAGWIWTATALIQVGLSVWNYGQYRRANRNRGTR